MILTPGRKRILYWAFFDLANTSYSIIVVTFLYAVYFKKTVVGGAPIGDFYWSLGTSLAMLITAVISPVLGAIADYSAGKKRFLLFFTILCILTTAALYFVGPGDVLLGIALFVLSNIGFEAGLVFYDAFLPEITTPKNYGRVSGYGFAMGYVGSFLSLVIAYPFIERGIIAESFPVAALFFLVFSLPLFLFLKEGRGTRQHGVSYISIGTKRVLNTIKNLRNYKNLAWFLAAFFMYIEGVNTVIYFAGNYASTTLGFTEKDLLFFFLTVQTTAIVGSVGLGIIADSIGQKRTITLTLVIWLATVLIAYFTTGKEAFYVVGLLAGLAMGSNQSTSRSLMSRLTPPTHKTEFFGFYSFFGKSSSILGPIVFGYVSYSTGSQRFALASLAIFFIVGLLLLQKVDDTAIPAQAIID